MRNLILTLTFLFSLLAWSAPKEQDRAILEGNQRNILSNPGFEGRKSNWTNTGSSTFTLETAAPAAGLVTAKWNPSASGEFFRSEVITIPEGLKNRECSLVFDYKWAGVSAEIKANVDDGSGTIGTVDLDPSTNYRQSPPIMFTCPGSGTIQVELESTADAAEISLDSFEFGKLKTIDISQAELTAQAVYNFTANCIWTTSSTSFVDFPTDSDCPAIQVNSSNQAVNAADDDLPTLVFDRLLPGKYIIQASGAITNTVAIGTVSVRIADSLGGFSAQGSNTFDTIASNDSPFTLTHSFTLTQAQAVTFNIQGAGAGSSVANLANNIIGRELQFTVYRFPLSSAEAITLETIGFLVNAKIVDAGGSTSLGASDTGAFVVIQDATLTLTNFSNATVNAKITCADATSPIGDDCGGADEQYGINFDVSSTGNYKVCFRFNNILNGTGGSENIFSSFNLVKTTASAEAIVETYPGVTTTNSGTATSIHGNPNVLCSIVRLDVGNNTIRMRNYTAISTGVIAANLITTTAAQDSAVFITVMKVDQQFPTPVFTDLQNSLNVKVSTTGTLNPKIFSMQGASGGGANNETGDWLDSVTNDGTGEYTLNITAGTFAGSGTFNCTASGFNIGGNTATMDTQTASTIGVETFTAAGAQVDSSYTVICHGF